VRGKEREKRAAPSAFDELQPMVGGASKRRKSSSHAQKKWAWYFLGGSRSRWVAMDVVRHLETLHEDLVHDVQFDYFGRRLATCASDQRIKVWDQDADGKWTCRAEGKGYPFPPPPPPHHPFPPCPLLFCFFLGRIFAFS
jgi:hypothetical protein